MGGTGSGRRGPKPQSRAIIEDLEPIKARDVAAALGLDPQRGRIAPAAGEGGQGPTLEPVACKLGGFRWWWRCPMCDRRRAALFALGGQCACRKCLDLTYKVCRESRKHDAAIRRMFPGKPKGVVQRAFIDIDLAGLRFGAPAVDRRGKAVSRRRLRKLIDEATEAGLLPPERGTKK